VKDEYSRRLLGLASSDRVRVALAKKYLWFEQALTKAWLDEAIPLFSTISLPQDKAVALVERFRQDGRIRQPDPQNPEEWEYLANQNTWEHTKWFDIQRVNEDIRDVFYDRDASQFVDTPGTPAHTRNKSVLCRQAPFVALVNDKGEFKGLVDRQDFLDQVAKHLAEQDRDS